MEKKTPHYDLSCIQDDVRRLGGGPPVIAFKEKH